MDAMLIEELTAGMPNTEELGDRDTMIDPPEAGIEPPKAKRRPARRNDSLGSLVAEARRSIVARLPTADGATGCMRLGLALAGDGPTHFADTVLDRPPTPLPRPAGPRPPHAETVRVAAPRLLLEEREHGAARFAAALAGLGALGIAVGTTLGLIFRAL